MRRGRRAPSGGFGTYLSTRAGYVVFFVVLFVVGVGFGAAAVRALGDTQKAELLDYLEVYLRGLGRGVPETPPNVLWRQAMLSNLRTAALMWGAGLVVVGLLVAPAVVFLRGFVIGFAVGFLSYELGIRGILIAALAVFPQNVLAVPAILTIAVASASYSVSVIRRGRRRGPGDVGMAGYTVIVLAMILALLAASTLEAYVAPVLMRLISGYGGG